MAKKRAASAPRKAAKKSGRVGTGSKGRAGAGAGGAAAERQLLRLRASREAVRGASSHEAGVEAEAYFDAIRADESGRAAAGRAGGSSAAQRRLRIVAEGDSWFNYPSEGLVFLNGGVIPRLSQRLRRVLANHTILSYAWFGDEVRDMLGVRQRAHLIRVLERASDDNIPFDAIVFSGGGNDVVGEPFRLSLKDHAPGADPRDALREEVFGGVLARVRAGYEDLLGIRDRYAPGCVVFIHSYCVPFPHNRGVCGIEPWLWPHLKARGWHDEGEQREIVRVMLGRFADVLRGLAAAANDVEYVDTQAIEIPRNGWANEIHPKAAGFGRVADEFERAIRERFGRPK